MYDWKELTPEEEEKLINSIAEKIAEHESFKSLVDIFLGGLKPLSYMGTMTLGLYSLPFLEFFGIHASEYLKLFRNDENIDKLLERINELTEKKKENKTEKAEKTRDKEKQSLWQRLFGKKG